MAFDSFYPPLGSTHTIAVPPSSVDRDDDSGVQLLLKARFQSQDAIAHCLHEGLEVQAWTNAPVVGKHPSLDDWAAYTFKPRSPVAEPLSSVPGVPPAGLRLSLVQPDPAPQLPPCDTLYLTLSLRTLAPDQLELRFSITYRLIYPNGDIQWLGNEGNNVVCILTKTNPWLAIRNGWKATQMSTDDVGALASEFTCADQSSTQSYSCLPFGEVHHSEPWNYVAIVNER